MDKSANDQEQERRQKLRNRLVTNHHPIYALSQITIPLSYAILCSLILSLVVRTFTLSVELGVRSILMAALPLLIATYFALFKRWVRHPKHIGKIPLYLATTGWTFMVSAAIRFLDAHPNYNLNFGVLLLSATLSALIFSRKYISFGASLSCSFGIVTGFFIYMSLFGFVLK
jgi:hypothetical protein